SIRHQQAALRHADGDQESQDQGTAAHYPRRPRHLRRHSRHRHRPHLSSRTHQADAALRGHSQGSSRRAGGKIEIRGAGDMSVRAVLEQRAGAWSRQSFETLAAAQQIAAEVGETASAAVLGKSIEGLAGELTSKKLDAVYTVEHDLLENYTPDGYVI